MNSGVGFHEKTKLVSELTTHKVKYLILVLAEKENVSLSTIRLLYSFPAV